MTASYRLKGPIGPPHTTSRHKRNHHEKAHLHHHYQHHRHGSLSFRSNEETDQMWRLEGRPLVLRHRRSVDEVQTDTDTDDTAMQRVKRQNQGCLVDYNSYRRLKIGCTRQDVIDVNPSCSEEGEEGELTL